MSFGPLPETTGSASPDSSGVSILRWRFRSGPRSSIGSCSPLSGVSFWHLLLVCILPFPISKIYREAPTRSKSLLFLYRLTRLSNSVQCHRQLLSRASATLHMDPSCLARVSATFRDISAARPNISHATLAGLARHHLRRFGHPCVGGVLCTPTILASHSVKLK